MRIALPILAVLLLAGPAFAADKPLPWKGDKQSEDAVTSAQDVKRVETYLTSLSTLTADFGQVDANGDTSHGKFFLKRPGKMRWQYAPPTNILLVSDGKLITYYDADLDQVNYLGIDDSLASFLAQPVIALNSDSTRLTEFEDKDKVIRATIVRRDRPEQGSLTLEFSDAPLIIRQMVVKDGNGNATTVQLQNAEFDMNLPDKLFTFVDPHGNHHRSDDK